MAVPDADPRGNLIGAHLVGIMVARHVTRVESLASMPVDDLMRAVAPTLQNLLFGDVGHGAVLTGGSDLGTR
jgi:Tetracyclin repressor-like, C-terminal domain